METNMSGYKVGFMGNEDVENEIFETIQAATSYARGQNKDSFIYRDGRLCGEWTQVGGFKQYY